MRNRTVCISFAAGCSRSMMDVGVLFKYFELNGWTTTDDPREAELTLVGGCGFDRLSEQFSLRLLTAASKKARRAGKVMVFGCLPGTSKDALAKRSDILPLPRSDFGKLDAMIGARVSIAAVADDNLVGDPVSRAREVFSASERLRAALYPSGLKMAQGMASRVLSKHGNFDRLGTQRGEFRIRIGGGCDSECTYCVIRKASGPVKSKPLDAIRQEFQIGLSSGESDINLVADDVGAYGKDIGLSVIDLLSTLLSYDGDYKISWCDLHPRWILQYLTEFTTIFREHQHQFGYIGIPIQSGSDRVLAMMKRGYTSGEVVEALSQIRENCPSLDVVTHLMIGFPGETAADFADTLSLMDKLQFRRVMPFLYTDRMGAESTLLPGKVSSLTKICRLYKMVNKIVATQRPQTGN